MGRNSPNLLYTDRFLKVEQRPTREGVLYSFKTPFSPIAVTLGHDAAQELGRALMQATTPLVSGYFFRATGDAS